MKHISSLLATAALLSLSLPLLTAQPAAAGAIECRPASQDYTVVGEKVPVRAYFRADARIVDHVYKNNRVHAFWDCTNSSGQPWVCIAQCRVDDEAIEGGWVYRGHLR